VVTPARAGGSVGALLGASLAHRGVRRVFGSPSGPGPSADPVSLPGGLSGIDGLGHVRVDDPGLAAGLAAAAGCVGPGPGVALLPGRRLLITAVPGLRTEPVVVTDPAHLMEVVATWDRGVHGACVEIVVDVDLDAPVPDGVGVLDVDEGVSGMILAPGLRGAPIVVLAGPGVRREGRVEALRTLAASGGIAVVVTAGAAGMLDGSDVVYAGVVGVQEHDVALSGLADAQVVIVTGTDDGVGPGDPSLPMEPGNHAGGVHLAGIQMPGAQVLEVPPSHLATLGLRWQPPDPPPPPLSPLRSVTASVIDELGGGDGSGPSPMAACAALSAVARPDMVVAADAGPAGLWLSRLPTPAASGALRLPGMHTPGFALSAAMAAALDNRQAIAVVIDPPDAQSAALLELAVSWNLDLVVVGWGEQAGGGSVDDAGSDGYVGRWTAGLRAAVRSPGLSQVGFAVDQTATESLVGQLGSVVGWPMEPMDW